MTVNYGSRDSLWGPDTFELVGGATCPDPSAPLTSSWQECRDAASSLGFSGDAIAHVDYNLVGGWGTRLPQGCFRSNGNGRFHFNTGEGGNFRSGDEILCVKAPTPPRDGPVQSCICSYPNGKLPPPELLPNHAIPSPPAFTLTNSRGMALGVRPKIHCNSDNDLDVETQRSDPNNPRQQFRLTHAGQIVNVGCQEKVITATVENGSCSSTGLKMSTPVWKTSGDRHNTSQLDQWSLSSVDGSITNNGCTEMVIASSKETAVTLTSVYFALQNPRTQLAMGVDGNTCQDVMAVEIQELSYGSSKQQFIYNEEDRTIVSLMCPDHALEVPSGDCSAHSKLYLSTDTAPREDGRNLWLFDEEGHIQNILCTAMFITIEGASSGGVRTIISPVTQFLEVSVSTSRDK